MKVACFMSGGGSKVDGLLDYCRNHDTNFSVDLIFSDNKNAKHKELGEKYSVPFETFDRKEFYSGNHWDFYDRSKLPEFYEKVEKKISRHSIDLIILLGYQSIVTEPLLSKYDMINSHLADLRVLNESCKPKYKGRGGLVNAVLDGQDELHSTLHVVSESYDEGKILFVSDPVKVNLPDYFDLKELKRRKILGKLRKGIKFDETEGEFFGFCMYMQKQLKKQEHKMIVKGLDMLCEKK